MTDFRSDQNIEPEVREVKRNPLILLDRMEGVHREVTFVICG